EEVVYARDPGLILRLDNLQRMSARAFWEHEYSNRTFTMTVEKKTRIVLVPKEWLQWPHRSEVERITYQPGADRILRNPSPVLNVWKGWGVEPTPGSVKPWLELLHRLFEFGLSEDRRWFEQWLAYPLQYPGTKLHTAAVLWSRENSTGK